MLWTFYKRKYVDLQIVGSNNLWKDYFVDALPFNVSNLSVKTIGGMTARELYFDGLPTTDGRVRAFLRIFENPEAKGVILFMPDKMGAEERDIAALYNRGFSVAVLDYTGETDAYPRFTLYPTSLNGCNAYGKTEFVADCPSLSSCWFVWTAIARRAVLLLKHEYTGKKIFAIGKGLGGSTVYKLCTFEDGLTAAATLLNVIPRVSGTGNFIIHYRAALDSSSYSQTSKIPLFMAVASNDEDSSLDQMSALAETTASLKCFRIVERTFSSGIRTVFNQIDSYFSAYLDGKPIIPRPKITASNSENKLYFNIKTGEGTTFKPEMFAAFCIENPTNRNWTKLSVITVADGGEYMARADVLQNDKPAYAFVNVKCDDGSISSSYLLSVVPKSLGIPAVPRTPHRLIYDGSMGLDVWTSTDGGNVEVKTGPYGIDGVCSDTLSLATFKPGDLMYRGEKDSLLQLSISGKQQSFFVSVSDGKDRYDCYLTLPDTSEWHKFTLSSSDFKNKKSGPLNNWTSVIMLEISSKDELIVGSALWV